MHHPRRLYLVDRSFQLKYILLLMAWGLVVAVLLGLWTFQAHEQAVETVVRDPEQRALLEGASRQLVWVLCGIGVLSVAALGVVGFVMTHRVAGPIYVMSHFLASLAEGRYPAQRGLRRRDELQRFYGQLMHASEALKERDSRHLKRLESVLGALKAALPGCPELAGSIAILEADVEGRREALADGPSSARSAVPAAS
ncbi:MAG TPA: hypothetical protein VLV17_08840 [Anaeromyxobacteraceae bacterium]|nr:hypothetical protein [Anaeromyxobacteraceae bacterium]